MEQANKLGKQGATVRPPTYPNDGAQLAAMLHQLYRRRNQLPMRSLNRSFAATTWRSSPKNCQAGHVRYQNHFVCHEASRPIVPSVRDRHLNRRGKINVKSPSRNQSSSSSSRIVSSKEDSARTLHRQYVMWCARWLTFGSRCLQSASLMRFTSTPRLSGAQQQTVAVNMRREGEGMPAPLLSAQTMTI